MKGSNDRYKDRTALLVVIGVLLLLVGVAAAVFGPAEVYCFYLFSEGGRLFYEGFGFGSLMFGVISWQIIGYYAIALLCVPLGYGHVRPRRWARVLTLSLLYCGLIVGIPLMLVFLLMLSVKDLSPTAASLLVAALALSYLLIPGLLIRFYRGQDVRQTFEAKDTNSSWIESIPQPVLVLAVLCVFYVIVMHIPLFFNGIFPLFGIWLSDIQGFLALDISILSLAALTWGVLRQSAWAWWGSVGYFGLLTLSSVVTLMQSSFSDILSLMRFPPTEMDALQEVPLQGAHFAPLIGIPLVLTLGVVILSKRHFGRRV
jgi:hypothetical protein